MKFYLKHHWGGGKASVGFDLDLIRTLVSMATVSSQRVTVGKTASSNSRMVFIATFLILAGKDDIMRAWTSSNFGSHDKDGRHAHKW